MGPGGRRLLALLIGAACCSGTPGAVALAGPPQSVAIRRHAAHRCRAARSGRHPAYRVIRCRHSRHAAGLRRPAGPAGPVPAVPAPSTPSVAPTLPAVPGPAESPLGSGPPVVPRVQVTAVEYSFTLSRATVPAGKVILEFIDRGQDEHNLNALGGEGELAGSFPNEPAGGVRDQTVILRPGSYTLFCSLPEHEQKGMRATLLVQ